MGVRGRNLKRLNRDLLRERRPIREMERAVDVDLFLEAQEQWAKDSPHHLIILHEMFSHATSEGQKEAEQVVHQGRWQHMPPTGP